MIEIERVVIDFPKTFGQPGIFLGCQPKMTRVEKTDAKSEQVQASDKNGGGLKWTASVAVKVKQFDRDKNKTMDVTLTSPTQPCANIAVGQLVTIENLEMGLMKQDRGGWSQFFSAAAIRPVTVQSAAPRQQ